MLKFYRFPLIIEPFFIKIGPAPIPYFTFQWAPSSWLAMCPGKWLGYVNLKVSWLTPYEYIHYV